MRCLIVAGMTCISGEAEKVSDTFSDKDIVGASPGPRPEKVSDTFSAASRSG